jgi:hypothetical protein
MREDIMGKSVDDASENPRDALETEEERTLRADELCCQACSETGLSVTDWKDFKAWNRYVEGSLDDSQLVKEAEREIDQFQKSFGKYVVLKSEKDELGKEESRKRERAKRANKIYRQVCRDSGLTMYFFHNFAAWSDYVNGGMSESEFYQNALEELKQVAARVGEN